MATQRGVWPTEVPPGAPTAALCLPRAWPKVCNESTKGCHPHLMSRRAMVTLSRISADNRTPVTQPPRTPQRGSAACDQRSFGRRRQGRGCLAECVVGGERSAGSRPSGSRPPSALPRLPRVSCPSLSPMNGGGGGAVFRLARQLLTASKPSSLCIEVLCVFFPYGNWTEEDLPAVGHS